MSSKIKNAIMYIGVFYMIVIIILMIVSYFNMITVVELSSGNEYKDQLNVYIEEINNVSDSTCKNYIKSLIKIVENDISEEEISIKDYFERINSEDNLLSYYLKAQEDCASITSEIMQENNMPIKFLTPPILGDEIIGKYFFQYEISIVDQKLRGFRQANLIPVENNIRIQNELQIIETLMKTIDWDKEV